MREIKFRVWQIEHQAYYNEYDGLYISADGRAPGAYHDDYYEPRFYAMSQDNTIIEQYIGFKDKKGIEIYEGDIVKYRWEQKGIGVPVKNIEKIQEVKWEKIKTQSHTYWGFNLIIFKYDCYDEVQPHIEIIGNINENPELSEA